MFHKIKTINNIKNSILPTLKNTTISTLLLTSSLAAYAGVYKNGTLDSFNGVVDNGSELIAVGDIGMIYTRALSPASGWVSETSGSVFRLLDVASAASFEDIAVGELGTILTRRSGSTSWSSEASGTLLSLRKALVDPVNGVNIVVGDEGLILFYDKVSSAWVTQTSGTTENLTSIVVNTTVTPSVYTVLGEYGTLLTSTDGQSWSLQTSANMLVNDALFYKTTGGADRYLAVGGYNVYESSDGISWSFLKSLTNSGSLDSTLNDIDYSADTNTITVVGNNGLKLTSTDDGATWTGTYGSASVLAATNYQGSLYSAAYNTTIIGNKSGIDTVASSLMWDMSFNPATGKYVAVGDNSQIITSTDGISWATATVPAGSGDIIAITFGGGQYGAITQRGNLLTSADGISWTSTVVTSSASLAATIIDIAYDSVNNTYVVISDSNVWTVTDLAVSNFASNPSLNAVIYSDNDQQFVAVGWNKIQTSPDGITWTNQAVGAAQGELRRFYGVMYNASAGLYVAVGETNSSSFTMTSSDGVTWTAGSINSNSYLAKLVLYDVTYDKDANSGSGQYVAVGWGGVMVSQDALTWMEVADARNSSTRYKSVVYDSARKQYLAIGEQIISRFSAQMIKPTFRAATVTTIESPGLYATLTSDITQLETSDYRGRSIIPTLINEAPNSRPYVMGAYTLTWEAIDKSGNRAQFDQSIVIEDTTAPTLTLNGQASVALEAGSTYADAGATASDIVDTSIAVIKGGTFVDTDRVGSFVITYNATDSSGNSAPQVSRSITITDSVAPTLAAVSDVSVYTTGALTSVSLTPPVATDATSVTVTGDAPASGYPVGDTLVTWTAEDAAGNQTSVSQTVTILPDNKVPVISLNGSATVTLAYGSTYSDLGASVRDDVDSNITLVTVNPVNVNAVGTYTITYNATDYTGNKAVEVTRTVNVVDREAPVITLNGSSAMRIEAGGTFTDPGSTVTDNVDTNLSATVTGTVNTNVAGNYTLVYSATDSSGNRSSRQRTVEVYTPADTENPVLVVPAPIVIQSPDGNGIANSDSRIQAFLGGATATDNVGVVAVGATLSPGTFPIGVTSVTFIAADAAGNEVTAVSTVTVNAPVAVDTTAPVITVAASVSVSSADGNAIALTNSEVQAYLNSVQAVDDSGVTPTLSISTLPDTLPIGTTAVTFTATDNAGNETQVNASIIIVDNSTPTNTGTTGDTTSGDSGGGGSMGWFVFLMSGFVFLTRRLKSFR